jgi:RNA polymerase sigma factor (sigma-70 family)
MLEPGDEQSLINAAVRGNSSAVERLLFIHFSALERHVRPRIPARVQRHFSVEDILQLVFSQVYRDIAQFQIRANASFLTWLKTIADHRLEDERKKLRRKKRGGEHRQLSMAEASKNNSLATLIDIVCQDSHLPDKSVARHEAEMAIQVAVAKLDKNQRAAIRARYFEGKSLGEIARQTGFTEHAVRGLLYRGKKNLREALGRSSQWLSSR